MFYDEKMGEEVRIINKEIGGTEGIILKKMKFGLGIRLDRNILDKLNVEMFNDHYFNDLCCKITGYVYKRDERVVKFEYYKNWWQELREQILPMWYTKKFPSKKEIKERVKVYSKYPTIGDNEAYLTWRRYYE